MELIDDMAASADRVAGFLKGLGNPQRLLVLCLLADGERSVSELMALTGVAQTSMSQHLARLREEGIVAARRDHRSLYYRIDHPAVLELVQLLHRHFCPRSQA